jgi:hypothetical protein
MLAQWIAVRDGHASQAVEHDAVIEEIDAKGCFGTDTMVLEAEALRAARSNH